MTIFRAVRISMTVIRPEEWGGFLIPISVTANPWWASHFKAEHTLSHWVWVYVFWVCLYTYMKYTYKYFYILWLTWGCTGRFDHVASTGSARKVLYLWFYIQIMQPLLLNISSSSMSWRIVQLTVLSWNLSRHSMTFAPFHSIPHWKWWFSIVFPLKMVIFRFPL